MATTGGKTPHPRGKTLRSQLWFDNPENPGMTALYLERYLNFGLTAKELRSGKPIVGMAQTGSDLSPCNRHHLELAHRVREGIRSADALTINGKTMGENVRRAKVADADVIKPYKRPMHSSLISAVRMQGAVAGYNGIDNRRVFRNDRIAFFRCRQAPRISPAA